jgi:hypothetical protein
MRAWLACIALAATLSSTTVAAQAPTQAQAEAHSHIMSAFLTGADPRLLSEGVIIGPRLKQQLGGDVGPGRVYEALIQASSGKDIQVRALAPAEAVRFASVTGVRIGDPLFALLANGLVLVLQYAAGQKSISFVEQLSRPLPRIAAAPKPEPPVLRLPPPPGLSAPAEAPAPATAPASAKPATPRPRGECVIKPVMSDDDLYNCGATPRQPLVPR